MEMKTSVPVVLVQHLPPPHTPTELVVGARRKSGKTPRWVLDIWYRDPIVPNRARKRGQLFEGDPMAWGTIGPKGGSAHKGSNRKSLITYPGLGLCDDEGSTSSSDLSKSKNCSFCNIRAISTGVILLDSCKKDRSWDNKAI